MSEVHLNRRTVLSGAVALGTASFGACAASPKPPARVNRPARRIVEEEFRSRQLPALQYAVVHKGAVVESGALGHAVAEHRIPATEATLFQINSITKCFMGVAVMQLVEAGRLRLEDRVCAHVPGLPVRWQDVTVEQVMTHMSGLPQIMDGNANLIGPDFKSSWQSTLDASFEFEPGAAFSYNGTNSVLTGKLIEALSGRPFTNFVTERQLFPTGMELTAGAGFVDAFDVVENSAHVYMYRSVIDGEEQISGRLHNNYFEVFAPPLRSAAGMYTTALELASWICALFANRLISAEARKPLWTPGQLRDGTTAGFSDLLNGYGLGWPCILRDRHPAVGGIGGGRAAFFVYPEDDLAVVVLTNLRGASPELFIDQIAAAYLAE